jgi:hypothetical protein
MNSVIKLRRNGVKLEFENQITQTWEKLKLIGFNQNDDDYSHAYGTEFQTLSNLDNVQTNDFFNKLVGQDITTNTAYNPLKMNFKRHYLPLTTNGYAEIPVSQEAIAGSSKETYADNVLFFKSLILLNINVTSMPNINITYAVPPTNADRGLPLALVETASGKIGNSGKLVGIVWKKATSNVTAIPTVTVSGGGLASPVTIPASFMQIRKRSINSVMITNEGYGYKINAVNRGLAQYQGQKPEYYYSMFDAVDKDSTHTVEPVIFGRIKTHNNIIPISGTVGPLGTLTYDYYSSNVQDWRDEERNPLFDALIMDGGEYMPGVNYSASRTTVYDSSNKYNRTFYGAIYDFNFEGWKGYINPETIKIRLYAKSYSESDLKFCYKESKKYGIIPLFDYFLAFKAYNNGGYTTSTTERIRQSNYYRVEFKTGVMRSLASLSMVTGDDQVMIILGNESNLDYMLQDIDYQIGSPTYGQNIYWADPLNPTNLQLNVEAMITFFDELIGDIKEVFGTKFICGIALQYADTGHCVQIETAFTKNLFKNSDFIGNNYYGNLNTTTPWINKNNVNVFTRYALNVPSNKRLPMIITEAGSPSKIYQNPTLGTLVQNYETEQAQIMKNILQTVNLYDEVCGVALFGIYNQPSRDAIVEAEYEGFNFPRTVANSSLVTFYNEKDFGILNFPVSASTDYNNNFAKLPNASTYPALAKLVLSVLRSEINTNYTEITKINR